MINKSLLRRSQCCGSRDSHLHGRGGDRGRVLLCLCAAGGDGGQGDPLRRCRDWRGRQDLQQHAPGRHHDRDLRGNEPRNKVKKTLRSFLCQILNQTQFRQYNPKLEIILSLEQKSCLVNVSLRSWKILVMTQKKS